MMGLADSPYHAFQAVTWAKELALVNIQDKRNTFRWERVVKNLLKTPHMTSVGHGCTRREVVGVLLMFCLCMWMTDA